ncbi:MAG: AAA family ATPase [Chloroflexota bacterium]|nr:AAA family ATPase [Chloroflexota bacterium]
MPCPHCATENPPQAKFCLNCGTPLGRHCANCGTELPAAARFCMSCGQAVTGADTPADAARLTRLAAATPAPLAAKMRAAHLAGERKVVTALFCDVVGSTGLAEQMDAEDWTGVMNRAFDRISPAVYHYEGTVARLLGDALLAFFGAPVAHEDDPVRAVRAGLDMLAAIHQYAGEVRAAHGIEFAVRVGINTGPVIVGEVGSDLKYEYTAMGDAVNLAARMQSAAQPGVVLISENTYRFVAPVFDCVDLGLVEVKGKAEPVRIYQVQAAKAAPGRVRGLAGLESPMVGRAAELAALLAAGQAAHAGQGRVAAIIGEPGLGKTRLIAEWKAADGAAGAGLDWAEGRCLSYGQGLAYHLLIDLLRALLGVPAAAGEAETRAALQAQTDDLFGADALDVYPYLGHLLSLPLEGAALERVRLLDPQALQAQYLAALRQLLRARAARRPLGLIFDDIHWADPSSTDLLIKLLPLTSDAPLLFCFVSRPDTDAPGWKLITTARAVPDPGLTELTLTPLSPADSRLLVSNLLEIEALPDGIRDTILVRAEGNPFFVEEVIRMLIDRGAIIKRDEHWAAGGEIETVEIPDNLQGLLLARIDRLPEDVKRTLRVASVIGRQFSVRVLEAVLSKDLEG